MSFNEKRLSKLDLAIVVCAVAAFVAGFLPWWGGSVDLVGGVGVTGWSAGSTAWAGTLLLTAAGVLLVLRRAGGSWPSAATGLSVSVTAVAVAGLVLVLVRWLSLDRRAGLGVDVGPRYGVYVALAAGAMETTASALATRGSLARRFGSLSAR